LTTKTQESNSKSELLDQYKRDLKVLQLTLAIIGENAESSKEIMRSRAALIAKIKELEKELSTNQT
jgi:hypothetical protein